MALFAIADLHLSLGTDKPMDVFPGWSDYVERVENNWKKLISNDDTVVIGGDISWAMKLEECFADFSFIHTLPGKKIFLKGNHDYWWGTKKKMDDYLAQNGFDSISILFNNAYRIGDTAVCGSRGWFLESETEEDIKVLNRETGRLEASILAAEKTGVQDVIVFLHYPPIYGGIECTEITEVLKTHNIKQCFYGHLHGTSAIKYAFEGTKDGISYRLISADKLNFIPILIK